MLNFRSSNAKCERSKCAVSAGVTVAADNRHAGLREAQLRSNYMHDSLVGRVHIEQRNSEVPAILLQRLNLPGRNVIGDGSATRFSRNVVVDRGHCTIRLTHSAFCSAQTVKSLRRSHLVDEMQIDIQKRKLAGRHADNMRIPDFV